MVAEGRMIKGGRLRRKTRIAVVGGSNTDMIVRMPRLPRPGETIIGGTFHTAAGDAFNAALAVAPGEGRGLPAAVAFANAAAAISVTRRGAQPSAPRRREIEAFIGKERIRL